MDTTTTDRNGWPRQLEPETGRTLVTFPNGRIGVYDTCHTCGGTGAVEASWGELYHCLVCSSRGLRLVEVRRTTFHPSRDGFGAVVGPDSIILAPSIHVDEARRRWPDLDVGTMPLPVVVEVQP